MIFEDNESQDQILKADSPKKQKSLGRKVKNFDDHIWSTVNIGHMRTACKAKVSLSVSLKTISSVYFFTPVKPAVA